MHQHPFLNSQGPIAFAHRGGARTWPENTMEAFAGCYELGFRYMETDVHLSKDGVVVAFHDPRLDRVSNVDGNIADKDWQELSEIRINGLGRIPTLQQLFQQFPDAKFNIDMKSDQVIQPLIELILEYGALDRVCLASFHDKRIRRARQLVGQVINGELCTSAGRLAIARYVGRSKGLPFANIDSQVIQVPLRRYGLTVFTERLLKQAHRDQKLVHVWTIDEPQEMHRLLDLGVDGLMTDEPSLLKQVYIERGIWSQV